MMGLVQSFGERTHSVEQWQQSVAKIRRVQDSVIADYGPDSEAAAAVFDDETETLKASLAKAEKELNHDLQAFVRIAKFSE